ncbi:hypothetical protein LB504_007906 [Fusarium proliferatum]|nr:hypothetical protein LB504_007906 [Fusarium proliferatum]
MYESELGERLVLSDVDALLPTGSRACDIAGSSPRERRIYVFMITSSKQGLSWNHWFSFITSAVATTNYNPPQLFNSNHTPLTKTHTLSKRPSSARQGEK